LSYTENPLRDLWVYVKRQKIISEPFGITKSLSKKELAGKLPRRCTGVLYKGS